MTLNALPIHHNTAAFPPPPPAAHSHHRPFSLFTHFYWGKNAEIFFSHWPGNNAGMYALALILVFSLAVAVELFSNIKVVKSGSKRVAPVLLQMGIHAIRAGFAYLVMLAVISYNGGIFIVAVVGHAVGYVLFGSPVFKKASSAVVIWLKQSQVSQEQIEMRRCLANFQHIVHICKMIHRKFTSLSMLSSPPSLVDASSFSISPQYSSFWTSYMMRFFPGWPNQQSLSEYCFSLFLVFLLAFTTEFCASNYSINVKKQSFRVKGLVIDAGLHGLRMFMAYLVVISVITTDFMFFLVALAGHTAGNFITRLFEYHIEQTTAAPEPMANASGSVTIV